MTGLLGKSNAVHHGIEEHGADGRRGAWGVPAFWRLLKSRRVKLSPSSDDSATRAATICSQMEWESFTATGL